MGSRITGFILQGVGRRCGKLLKEFEEKLLKMNGLETGFFDMEEVSVVEEKMGFWNKLHKSKKGQVIFFMLSMGVLLCVFSLFQFVSHKEMLEQLDIIDNDFLWLYQIESVDASAKQMQIEGWAFELETDSLEGAVELVLQDIKTKELHPVQMNYVERKDVNDYFLCEYDYRNSGFVASVSLNQKDISENTYEVLFRPKDKKYLYSTEIFIESGKIKRTNPLQFVGLDVIGTDLEKVVEEGTLCVYQPNYEMYVYQYEGKLYWIADEDYYFEDDGSTYIQYQLWTTQKENLPTHRVEAGWRFDNIGFLFEEYELLDFNTGKYRVAVNELPTNYSLGKIETGYYVNNEWIWRELFYPNYGFKMKCK